jgi:nucleoside-diphosphate-sugar epimerase
LNAFTAASHHGISKVVYTSSISVFGPDGSGIPQPTTHYGAFKLANEGSARTVWESDRLTSFGIRPGIVYGPGRESGLTAGITQACRSAAAGEEYAIPFSGDVNLVYVDEVASAYEAALLWRQEGAQIFNMFGAVAKVAEVAAEIRRQVQGAAISVDGPALPFAALRTSNEPELAGLEKVDLPDGIAATIAHYGGAGGDN